MAPPLVELGSQGLKVSAQGLGCMGLVSAYSQPGRSGWGVGEKEAIELLKSALNMGVTFWDTAQLYIRPEFHRLLTCQSPIVYCESVIGAALKEVDRDKIQLATKTGLKINYMTSEIYPCGTYDFIKQSCNESLARLGVKCIDLYYLHRVDPKTPIEESMRAMKDLKAEGKINYVGLSEASAATIRRAHAVVPITCVQMEWSLFSRDIEAEVVPCCMELGIGLVAYSPLGRGVLSGTITSKNDIKPDDWRTKGSPRFAGENLERNLKLVENVSGIAKRLGVTNSQVALAWVEAKGRAVGLKGCVAIPGTTKAARVAENLKSLEVQLSAADLAELERAVPAEAVVGERYAAGSVGNLHTDDAARQRESGAKAAI